MSSFSVSSCFRHTTWPRSEGGLQVWVTTLYQPIICTVPVTLKMVMPENICQPQDIVNRIRHMTKERDEIIDDNKSTAPTQVSVDNLTAIDDTPSEERTAPQRNISQRALADAVVREGRI